MKSTLRRRLVEGQGSIGEQARTKRAEHFLATFPELASMHVLDLGGTALFWSRLSMTPASVTAVNVSAGPDAGNEERPWFNGLIGDACDSGADFGRDSFDLVFSNSTIEHVGDRGRRKQFADTVHAKSDRHWIQTPNRAFPLEPHVLFPLEQFLPRRGRALVARYWPLVHTNAKTMEGALRSADGTELIGRRELTQLFPGSTIEDEVVVKFLPAKSLIAIKQ